MATDPQVLFCVVLTLLLPLRIHSTLSPIQERLRQPFGSIRLNAAWNVLCVTLSVLACRRWGIELWQRGLRGMVALAGREVLRTICSLPYIRGTVRREVAKELKAIEVSIHGKGDPTAVLELPKQGLPHEEILRRIQVASASEAAEYVGVGKKWAGIYHSPVGELVDLQNKVWGIYNCSNTLYEGVFPSVRKYEAELISWAVRMLNGTRSTCGLLTSGGTESVMLAALCYRELGRSRGIATPRILAANTCHPCIVKACHYFGITLTKIPVDESTGFALRARRVRRHLTRDVVCIYASAPTFPHGVVDCIEDLGVLAERWGVGLHVDNCLGGVLLSYMDKQGLTEHQAWDFRVPGVSSISVDLHKYGNTSKGVSVVAFRDPALRRLTYVPVTDGCEGLYVTPTMQGARGGAVIAQAWATMLFFGDAGYAKFAARIHRTHRLYQDVIDATPGLRVLCKCHACIVPVGSSTYNIYSVASLLEEKGWNLATGQFPPCLTICIGERHDEIINEFSTDLRAAVDFLDATPSYKPSGAAAVYGAMPTTPTAVLEEVVRSYVDMRMSIKPAES
ncbi:SGPL1 [Symbiodinium sp. CCMP2592]|nr:SGPL1 [Symbiodinium sp. CCMP2592]